MPRKSKKQAPRAATGQAYGEAGAQLAAQRAIPLPDNTGLPPQTQVGQPTPAGSLGAFTRETERPLEPVTTGAPIGPGLGPVDAGISEGESTVDLLAAAYRASGSEELRGMLEEAQTKYNDY